MIIDIGKIHFNVLLSNKKKPNDIPVVFFHGFTGNSNDWKNIITNLPNGFYSLAIDLIGHGKSSSPSNKNFYTLSSQIQYLDKIFSKLKIVNPVLVGYSMGGRFALSYAMKNKKSVKALVLESTAFGYKLQHEKEDRILSDKILAEKIINGSLNDFFDFWYNLPLFNSLRENKNVNLEKIKKEKILQNNKIGLANSLLGFGTGTMDNYFEQIDKFESNVLLITGSLDKKFTSIAKEAKEIFPNAEHKIVNNCGHNVHLEKPEEFLKFLNRFLKNIKEQ